MTMAIRKALSTQESSPPSSAPTHLSEAALRFLRGLARHNDRAWFEQRRAVYETELKRPMLSIVASVTDAMTNFAPDHVRPPEKILMRIYRDTRFSSDKRPYKTHASAWWTRRGLDKTSGAGFYFHVSGKEVVIAAGVYMPEAAQLLAIRRYLLEQHAVYRSLVDDRRMRKLYQPDDGNPLTRAPKGFPKDHPADDLVRQRQWGVHASLPAEAACEPAFAKSLVRYFAMAAPLVALLNTPLVQELPNEGKARRKPLF
jgi:uncharacterized protein (TIGR02453 family)